MLASAEQMCRASQRDSDRSTVKNVRNQSLCSRSDVLDADFDAFLECEAAAVNSVRNENWPRRWLRMSQTQPSLERLREHPTPSPGGGSAEPYTSLIHDWLRRHSIQQQDADDLVQEVLGVVVREMPAFHYDPERGSFRMAAGRHRPSPGCFLAARRACGPSPPATATGEMLEQLGDPDSEPSRRDLEHDPGTSSAPVADDPPEFEADTWRAFEQVVLKAAGQRTSQPHSVFPQRRSYRQVTHPAALAARIAWLD